MSDMFKVKKPFYIVSIVGLSLLSMQAFAAVQTLGQMASQITSSFESVGKLITASSYIGGLGFFISAIMKFKQHKDNPTQIPVGTPIALVFVAAALLFLPSILDVAGGTMFGSAGGQVAGPGGITYGSDNGG